jgi:hypothetical protein
LAGILKEARDLQTTQLAEVPNKLAPLLAELRQLQQGGKLDPEISKIYQEALLLQISAQTKLLAPESDITAAYRELLVVNPKLDDSAFNPREKQLLDKMRSAETGRLSLKTDPPGITLLYIGIDLGTTPVDVSLIAGAYRLLLRKEGFRDQEFDVTIRPSEILSAERTMRRRAVEIPLSTDAVGISVVMNGQVVGKTQPVDAWITSLPTDRQEGMRTLVRQWGSDARSGGFLRLPEVNVGEPVTLELQAPCYQPARRNFTVSESEVDWSTLVHVRPELRRIELKRDTGFMEVTSVPSGAEVWIDGTLSGKTPLQRDICVGTHRIQVLHSSGQYRQEVVVQRDQITKVAGEVRPALLFLGTYTQAADKTLRPVAADWEIVARQLVLRGTAFLNMQLAPAEIESLRGSGKLPLEQLLASSPASVEADALIKRIAADNGRVDMFLFGLRNGSRIMFRLYSALHRIPDLIELPGLDDAALAFLVARLNRADRVSARLFLAELGIDLFDSPYGLAIQSAPAGQSDLAPGSIVRAVDQKAMNLSEFQAYVRTLQTGRSVTLDAVSAKGASSRVVLSVRMSGAEYPWSTPDAFPNAVLTTLHYLAERDPAADVAKYASLSLARGFMEQGEWKLALEYLARTNLEPNRRGICPGTVLYYQGRCYEALADINNAQSHYARAKGYPDATLGTHDGPAIPALAEWRIQSLKRQSK